MGSGRRGAAVAPAGDQGAAAGHDDDAAAARERVGWLAPHSWVEVAVMMVMLVVVADVALDVVGGDDREQDLDGAVGHQGVAGSLDER